MQPEQANPQHIGVFKKQIKQLPATKEQIQYTIKKIKTQINKEISQKTIQKIFEINNTQIEKKFTLMMQQVFKAIEPVLKQYRKYDNINYLDPIILKNLDQKIYHKGYKLHKNHQTPMEQLLKNREVDFANKFFTEIFDIMNQLMTTMRIYYGFQQQQQISQALYESIALFAQKQQNCQLVAVDRRSYIEQQQKQKQKKDKKHKKQNEAAPYDVLLDVIEAIGKDKANLNSAAVQGIFGKASNLINVIYKYAIAPSVSYTYQKIKNINPLAINKKLTVQQQLNLRMSLIQNLRPNLSIRNPLQQKMVTFLIKMIPMQLDQIVTLMSQNQKNQFIQIVTDVLNDFQNPNVTFQKIVKQLMKLLQLVQYAQEDIQNNHYIQYKEAKWIIIFYKAFQQNYSPERRRVLFKICHLDNIKKKLINPIGILKLVQSQKTQQTQLLKLLRSLQVPKKLQQMKKSQMQSIKECQIHMEVNHQLNRIHLFQLKDKYDAIPVMKFQRLTQCPSKRVITLLFSGFMTEDTCKIYQWDGLLNTIYDSQIYSIGWQSKSYGSVFDFAVQSAKDIAQANLKIGILGSIGGPYLQAIAIIRQIYKKYNSNPFNPAYRSALKTGHYLAEIIMRNFKGHFINLVGYSLGTELMKNIMQRMAQKNCLHMINKVYFMGGLTDKAQIEQILKKTTSQLTIINLYSQNDSLLKYLLKLCKRSVQPIGLNQIAEIPGHNVKNRDCSVIIDGHLAYRNHINLLAKLFNMKDD